MNFYIDFDKTLVEQVGDALRTDYHIVDNCIEVLNTIRLSNHTLILNTFRANQNDVFLKIAVDFITPYFKFDSVNSTKLSPEDYSNIFNNPECIFIDDICKGIPLCKSNYEGGEMVDWLQVKKDLIKTGIIK